jgi:hypothetical protein
MVTCFDMEDSRRKFLLTIYAMGIATNDEFVFINPQLRSQGMLQQSKCAKEAGNNKKNLLALASLQNPGLSTTMVID